MYLMIMYSNVVVVVLGHTKLLGVVTGVGKGPPSTFSPATRVWFTATRVQYCWTVTAWGTKAPEMSVSIIM